MFVSKNYQRVKETEKRFWGGGRGVQGIGESRLTFNLCRFFIDIPKVEVKKKENVITFIYLF